MRFVSIDDLKGLITEQLSDLVTENYVLLDLPNHKNVGDQLIYKGELDFLRTLPYICISSSSVGFNFDDTIEPNLILLHGGGNFGNLYSMHQNFREKIIRENPAKRIIIFPQSVHFSEMEDALRSAEVFNDHEQVTICARDQFSYDFLKKHFNKCSILMLPDMAFCSTYQISKRPSKEILIMKRRDGELGASDTSLNAKDYPEIDWPTFEGTVKELLYKYYESSNNKISKYYYKALKANSQFGLLPLRNENTYTQIGIDFLSDYKFVITTRLHGHILCLLLGLPSIIVNNSYGKNRRYYDTWLKDVPNTYYADTVEQAVQLYRELNDAK